MKIKHYYLEERHLQLVTLPTSSSRMWYLQLTVQTNKSVLIEIQRNMTYCTVHVLLTHWCCYSSPAAYAQVRYKTGAVGMRFMCYLKIRLVTVFTYRSWANGSRMEIPTSSCSETCIRLQRSVANSLGHKRVLPHLCLGNILPRHWSTLHSIIIQPH